MRQMLLLSLVALFCSEPSQAALLRNYAEVQAFMLDTAIKSEGRAAVVDIGVSDGGQMIQALRIGSGPVSHLVVATHHGNEYGSTEVARGFAAALAESPIQGQTVYVIPVLNISGFNSRNRHERGHDPNRDYPGPCGGEGPHALKSTALLAEFVERAGIVASATLHTSWPAVVYPWGFGTRDVSTPYDDLYKLLVDSAVAESGYATGNSAELIYPANGTFEDYAFWKHGVWSLLFELGHSHYPSEADVREMVRVNTPGLRRFLEQAPRTRAENHAFAGQCDRTLSLLDRHDE